MRQIFGLELRDVPPIVWNLTGMILCHGKFQRPSLPSIEVSSRIDS
jgi:hypothetical protein